MFARTHARTPGQLATLLSWGGCRVGFSHRPKWPRRIPTAVRLPGNRVLGLHSKTRSNKPQANGTMLKLRLLLSLRNCVSAGFIGMAVYDEEPYNHRLRILGHWRPPGPWPRSRTVDQLALTKSKRTIRVLSLKSLGEHLLRHIQIYNTAIVEYDVPPRN
jgi:hypothetical protein